VTVSTTTPRRPAPVLGEGAAATTLTAVAITVTAWSSAFVAIRDVRDAFDPGALALGRLLLGCAILGAILLARRTWVAPTRREWVLLVACGVAWFALYNVVLNAAEQRVDAGTAAMLVGVGPIIIALLAGAVLGEGFPRWLLAGALVAFGGVVVIGIATTGGSGSDALGIVFCVTAAFAWAVGVLTQKPVLRRIPALQATWTSCTIGMVACLPFCGQLWRGLGHASAGHTADLVYLGAVPTSLAFCTWAFALSRMPAGRLGVTTYLVPPLTIAIAWPTLGERPPVLALAGGLIALVGVSLSRRR
jgi:drug/metabolite transporter (DMT)-like permease